MKEGRRGEVVDRHIQRDALSCSPETKVRKQATSPGQPQAEPQPSAPLPPPSSLRVPGDRACAWRAAMSLGGLLGTLRDARLIKNTFKLSSDFSLL